jgi:hypothetical protein
MRRPTVQGAARRTHNNKFQYHDANRWFRRVSRTPLQRTEADGRAYSSKIWRISPHTWSHVLSRCCYQDEHLGNSKPKERYDPWTISPTRSPKRSPAIRGKTFS